MKDNCGGKLKSCEIYSVVDLVFVLLNTLNRNLPLNSYIGLLQLFCSSACSVSYFSSLKSHDVSFRMFNRYSIASYFNV